ncbi:MAG: hypothetical protein V1912_07785 [bacterium]
MQAALGRLAASLETFAAGVLTDNLDKTAIVEDRVQTLERELEQTRARLQEAETLLNAAAAAPASAAESAAGSVVAAPAEMAPATEAAPFVGVGPVAEAGAFGAEADRPATAPDVVPMVPPPSGEPSRGFRLEEVQAVQRYFNESPFAGKTRDVRRSLGKPQVNLTRTADPEPRTLVTVAWDIVWYQYLVDLRRDIPSDQRIILHREGMSLDELADHFKEKNASVDDHGRLDASELEVRLLSDPSALISEMTPDAERALEDATEEIWDQSASPEFKWDD